jgi:hypothetical protein
MTAVLTKSDLTSYRQCSRKLWLEHNRPGLIPQNDPTLWRRANDDNIVGTKAREPRGPDVIWPKAAGYCCAAANAAIAQLSASVIRRQGRPDELVIAPLVRDHLQP